MFVPFTDDVSVGASKITCVSCSYGEYHVFK